MTFQGEELEQRNRGRKIMDTDNNSESFTVMRT